MSKSYKRRLISYAYLHERGCFMYYLWNSSPSDTPGGPPLEPHVKPTTLHVLPVRQEVRSCSLALCAQLSVEAGGVEVTSKGLDLRKTEQPLVLAHLLLPRLSFGRGMLPPSLLTGHRAASPSCASCLLPLVSNCLCRLVSPEEAHECVIGRVCPQNSPLFESLLVQQRICKHMGGSN